MKFADRGRSSVIYGTIWWLLLCLIGKGNQAEICTRSCSTPLEIKTGVELQSYSVWHHVDPKDILLVWLLQLYRIWVLFCHHQRHVNAHFGEPGLVMRHHGGRCRRLQGDQGFESTWNGFVNSFEGLGFGHVVERTCRVFATFHPQDTYISHVWALSGCQGLVGYTESW